MLDLGAEMLRAVLHFMLTVNRVIKLCPQINELIHMCQKFIFNALQIDKVCLRSYILHNKLQTG